jgi:hypothetical protein
MAHTFLGEQRPAVSSIRSNGGVPVLDETFHHLVLADSKFASRLSILATTGVPVAGVTLSPGGFALCKSVKATRRDDQVFYWDIVSEFSSEVSEQQSSQDPRTDPEQWVPVYETKFERLQENATSDQNGVAIANSAGQPFETGIIRARYIPVWEFFQLEAASITDETVIGRNEVVNSATFRGRAAKTLLCTVMSSVIGYYYGSKRRLTRYSLKYNNETWRHKRLDVGTVYLDFFALVPYLDDGGNVILGALDGNAGKANPGDPPAVLEFDMFAAVDFSAFLRI